MIRFLYRLLCKLRRTRMFECFYCGRKQRVSKSIITCRCSCGNLYRLIKFGKINDDGTQSVEIMYEGGSQSGMITYREPIK